MLRNDSSTDYDPGIKKETHYAIVVFALVVGLVVGGLMGIAFKDRQTTELRFGRDLASISGATVTLELVEQGQREQIRKFQQNLLTLHTRDAYTELPTMKRFPLKTPQLVSALSRAQTYAVRQKMTGTAAELGAIRQKIEAQQ